MRHVSLKTTAQEGCNYEAYLRIDKNKLSTASDNWEKLLQLEKATASLASTSQEQPAAQEESSSQEQVEAEEAPSSPIQPPVEVEEESKEPSLVSGKAPLNPVEPSYGSSAYAISGPVTTPSKGLLRDREKECIQKCFGNDTAQNTLPLEQVRNQCCTNDNLV